MVIICNFNVAFLKISKLLTDDDIESNPGPTYEIVKAVQGSFNQGHPQFGATSGVSDVHKVLPSGADSDGFYSSVNAKLFKTNYYKQNILSY